MPRRDLAGSFVLSALLAALPASAQQTRVTPVPQSVSVGGAAAVGSELSRARIAPSDASGLILPAPLARTLPAPTLAPRASAAAAPAQGHAPGVVQARQVPAAGPGIVAQSAPAAGRLDAPQAPASSAETETASADDKVSRDPAESAGTARQKESLEERTARAFHLMPVEEFLSSFFDGASPAAASPDIRPDIEHPSSERPGSGLQGQAEFTELDGHAGGVELAPGSIFTWRPIEEAPGHGLAPLDWLIKKALAHKSGRFPEGFEFAGAQTRAAARVFFYGERHTDKALIAANMRRLAGDILPERGAIVLDEGYFGPALRGYEALVYLMKRGFDPEALAPRSSLAHDLEVRGWDRKEVYDLSLHPVLQHHMNLYDLNQHLFSGSRGLAYYVDLARKLYAAWRNWKDMRALAIDRRNQELDASVRAAAEEGRRTNRSVHVIAGAEHLVERPLLAAVPLIGRPSMRKALAEAVGAEGWWASKPADTPGLPD